MSKVGIVGLTSCNIDIKWTISQKNLFLKKNTLILHIKDLFEYIFLIESYVEK